MSDAKPILYYVRNGRVVTGPFDIPTLCKQKRSGMLLPGDEVSQDGMSWKRVDEVIREALTQKPGMQAAVTSVQQEAIRYSRLHQKRLLAQGAFIPSKAPAPPVPPSLCRQLLYKLRDSCLSLLAYLLVVVGGLSVAFLIIRAVVYSSPVMTGIVAVVVWLVCAVMLLVFAVVMLNLVINGVVAVSGIAILGVRHEFRDISHKLGR